jgi:hypothetical protein
LLHPTSASNKQPTDSALWIVVLIEVLTKDALT